MIRISNPKYNLNISTSVALGTYDGLHKGHMEIINRLVGEGNFSKCVFTFSNSPALVATNVDVSYILSQQEKSDILCQSGVEYLVTCDFDKEIMSLSAEEFFEKYILSILGAKELFVGFNYTFGRNKSGNTQVLKELCENHNIKLSVIPPVYVGDEPVSSSRIRGEISLGNLDEARELLGRPVTICGRVCEGNKIGRTLDFPTVNIPVDNGRALPPDGVYKTKTVINEIEYKAIANLGARPTVSDKGERLFEGHIIGFSGNLYDEYLTFEFISKIRDIRKFSSVEELKNQLRMDIEEAK
ncbi:MAG: bifunctional riboflavin kinase/FAD synthetase [Eubacteriales bacterium]|nr:bifunctional riboflavin kinase/FAD synthetase [Eubacteriales bacterium]